MESTLSKTSATNGDLSSLFDRYASPDSLQQAEWLTQLDSYEADESYRHLDRWTKFNKRFLDIFGASLVLVVCSPIMLITAILVKLTSPGPVIFCQQRVGLNQRSKTKTKRRQLTSQSPPSVDRRSGEERRCQENYGKPFMLYKFRSMVRDAEKNGAQFATKGDSRVTPIGRFIRLTRIDELPQLWNVLRGDMSLVGPRPERPEFMLQLSEEIPNYLERLELKPGLTGIAQVINGYDNNIESFRRKVTFDLLYRQTLLPPERFENLICARSAWS